jgi:hypothetical protein
LSFFKELKRRNVCRVGAMYLVAGWLILQIMDVVGPILDLPESLAKLVLLVLAIGFPVALIMAWAFEMTPGGLVRDGANNAPRYAPGQRRTIDYFIFGTLLVALDGFETAFEARDNSLFYIGYGAQFDSLRNQPRFEKLVERMKL